MDKIIGLGNALVDVLATFESDEVLQQMGLPRGSMTLIDEERLHLITAYFKDLKQEFANDGFKGVTPPESAEKKIEKESESIAKMIDEGTKTIVEQNKN